MTNQTCKTVLWVVLVGFLGLQVYGQEATHPLVPIPNPATMVLRSNQILRELGLAGRWAPGAESLLDDIENTLWRMRDDTSGQRNQKALTLIQRLKMGLSLTLSAYQIHRYQQIVWQAQGVQAFLDPEIVFQLGLTQGQQQLIHRVITSYQAKISQSQGNDTLLKQSQARAEREAFAALNAAQQQRMKSLLGVSVDFSRVPQRAIKAPEFEAVDTWVNSPPVTLAQFKGKVTVVHFYTYGCINCIRNLPHYNGWFQRFTDLGVQVIGIHRPESEGERRIESVEKKAVEAGIQYPVAIDNQSLNWNAWGNHTWPSVYLVDKQGFVRYWWYGELNWQGAPGEARMRGLIKTLLKEPLS